MPADQPAPASLPLDNDGGFGSTVTGKQPGLTTGCLSSDDGTLTLTGVDSDTLFHGEGGVVDGL